MNVIEHANQAAKAATGSFLDKSVGHSFEARAEGWNCFPELVISWYPTVSPEVIGAVMLQAGKVFLPEASPRLQFHAGAIFLSGRTPHLSNGKAMMKGRKGQGWSYQPFDKQHKDAMKVAIVAGMTPEIWEGILDGARGSPSEEWLRFIAEEYKYIRTLASNKLVLDAEKIDSSGLSPSLENVEVIPDNHLEHALDNKDLPAISQFDIDFEKQVEMSRKLSNAERRKRLANAQTKPQQIAVKTIAFIRNPDVVAEVLNRANGYCEKCKRKAPFLRAKDGTPYLEVHHRIPLANGGDDTVENAEALCPNCHREAHFG